MMDDDYDETAHLVSGAHSDGYDPDAERMAEATVFGSPSTISLDHVDGYHREVPSLDCPLCPAPGNEDKGKRRRVVFLKP